MVKNTDDIVGGSRWSFNPPYRFIVGRYVKYDKKQDEIIHIVDDPTFAYAIYVELKENDKIEIFNTNKSAAQYLNEWYLKDSFGKDALEFCKKETEKPIEVPPVEEKAEAEEK